MAEFENTRLQTEELLAKLGGLDMADRDEVRAEIVSRLNAILDSMDAWKSASPSDDETVGAIREQIADIRLTLPRSARELETVRTEWAERYRKAIGDGKDAFEKLSEQMQQNQSPEAYRWKRNFSDVTAAMEAVNRLNATLMDASSRLERQNAAHKPPVPDTAPPGRTDRDPDMTSNLS